MKSSIKFLRVLTVITAFFALSTVAHAKSFSLVGVATHSNVETNSVGYGPNGYGYGGGLLIDFGSGAQHGWELGVIYGQRKLEADFNGSAALGKLHQEVDAKYIQV